jgi:hypothetical protein
LGQEARIGASEGLWVELGRVLRRLESIAARPPEELAAEAAEELAHLQYALHRASERLVAHTELADALAAARDATAEIAEVAAESGWTAAAPLVYEWRGALFRVRLARMLLAPAAPAASRREREDSPQLRAALAAFGLTLSGGAAFVSGAVIAAWPLWTAGMVAVVAGLLLYRP